MAEAFESLLGRARPQWFAGGDPEGNPLGSGGGTANLLAQAWRATAPYKPFAKWLCDGRRLLLHGGGQSRRLPAYAPSGKLLMPIPALRCARGQRPDQTLLDLQLPDYQRVLAHAGPGALVMVASGDTLLRFARELPPFPNVDVLGLGISVAPELAKDFGVFFSPRHQATELAFFLQKPAAGKIRELARHHLCLVDTGAWLLSERAVRVLMELCGWDARSQEFTGGTPNRYELYAQFGLGLGRSPSVKAPVIAGLSCAVVPLPEGEFYHFGTNAQMLESVVALQNVVPEASKVTGEHSAPARITQNSRVEIALGGQGNRLWVENSVVPAGWRLASEHILTGVPGNDWHLCLATGDCLDFVPVGADGFCVRAYGFEDSFSGKLGAPTTRWLGRPASEWFAARCLGLQDCSLDPQADIQSAPLFPVLALRELDPAFIQWLLAAAPRQQAGFARLWRDLPRLSAQQLGQQVNLRRLFEQRDRLRQAQKSVSG
jgi:hypothetical protein